MATQRFVVYASLYGQQVPQHIGGNTIGHKRRKMCPSVHQARALTDSAMAIEARSRNARNQHSRTLGGEPTRCRTASPIDGAADPSRDSARRMTSRWVGEPYEPGIGQRPPLAVAGSEAAWTRPMSDRDPRYPRGRGVDQGPKCPGFAPARRGESTPTVQPSSSAVPQPATTRSVILLPHSSPHFPDIPSAIAVLCKRDRVGHGLKLGRLDWRCLPTH
jgi:hypothetical protein